MPTLKQIEAVHWIVQTGSFLAAARRLNATQSTISKRVREIEEELGGAAALSQRCARHADPARRDA